MKTETTNLVIQGPTLGPEQAETYQKLYDDIDEVFKKFTLEALDKGLDTANLIAVLDTSKPMFKHLQEKISGVRVITLKMPEGAASMIESLYSNRNHTDDFEEEIKKAGEILAEGKEEDNE